MHRQDGGIGTIRRAVAGALSMAILAIPAVAAAGGVQPTAQTSRAQVQSQVRTRVKVVKVQKVQVRQRELTAIENPRALGGFVFQPPATLGGPFITNHIRVDTSMGMVKKDAVTPHIEIPGGPATYDLRLGAIQERASVGIALTPRLGLNLDGAITSFGGSNSQSALHVGSGVAFEARPGLKIGLVNDQNRGIAVGMQAYGIAVQAMGMSPAGMISGMAKQASSLLQGQAQLGADITEGARIDKSMLGGGMSLSAAKNIGKHVGLQMEVGGEASRVAGGNAVQGRIEATPRTIFAGTAASIDLSPIVPVGAMLEYRLDHSVIPVVESSSARVSAGDVGRSTMHRLSGGLYYTARKNLALGVAGTYGLARGKMPGAPSTGKPAQLVGGRLTVGYFF